MDMARILSAIFQKIDENLQQMEARFDEIQQIMKVSPSPSPVQIPSVSATEKELLASEREPLPGNEGTEVSCAEKTTIFLQERPQVLTYGNLNPCNLQLRDFGLQFVDQQAPVECLQEDSENLVKTTDIVIAQDSELESLANSREHGHGVLEAPPTKLNWEINSEARNLSFSNKFEFGGNNTALNLELPTFGDCIWARQCEKHYRICGIIDAHHVFVEMPIRRFIGSAYSNQVCKAQFHLGNCVFDPGIAEGLHYSSDCFSKQVVEQASLKWEGCGLILIPASHCNGSKLIRSCEYGSRIVDRRVGDVISVFDPGVVCNDRISKFLSALATTWVVFGCTGDVTIVIAPSLPYDRGKEAPLTCSQMVVVDSYMFMVSLFAIEVLDVYLVGSERLKVDSNAH